MVIVNFFRWLWDLAKSLVNLVVPVFGQAKALRGLRTATTWAIRLVVLALIVAGLYWVNTFPDVKALSYVGPPFQDWYLPILFLLAVGLAWVAVLFWRALFAGGGESEFPDIDEAWAEARAALDEAGIDLTEVPIFLVLGRPLGGERPLFQTAFSAADRRLVVAGAPARPDAPLHVYVGEFKGRSAEEEARRGIYVTCEGASLLSAYAKELAGALDPEWGGGAAPDRIFATMNFGSMAPEAGKIFATVVSQKRKPSPEEQNALRQVVAAEEKYLARRIRQGRVTLFGGGDRAGRHTARLRHLCGLIARDRRPWCPANGALVLIPWDGTDTQEVAGFTAQACAGDLEAARDALGARVPVQALVADMETVEGFPEFVARTAREDRDKKRPGRGFPLNPRERGENLNAVIASGMKWFATSMLTPRVYRLFKLEREEEGASRAAAVDGNVRLHQVLTQLLERQNWLTLVLTQGFLPEADEPPLFGGCYVAATGKEADQQVFVAGVLHKLIEEQNNIAWTDRSVAEDAWYHRATRWAWVAAFGLAAGLAGLVAHAARGPRGNWVVAAGLGVPPLLVVGLTLLLRNRSRRTG